MKKSTEKIFNLCFVAFVILCHFIVKIDVHENQICVNFPPILISLHKFNSLQIGEQIFLILVNLRQMFKYHDIPW